MTTTSSNNFRAILFDLDGTILDTYTLILTSMQYATKKVLEKELPPEVLMKKVGQPLVVQFWDFTSDQKTYDELIETYRIYNAKMHDELARPFEGTAEVLSHLRSAGYPLGVVTSKRHEPAAYCLRHFKLDTYFDCLVGADDCLSHKPEPGPVIQGAKLLGFNPNQCLFVGDSPYDIHAGNAAGASTAAALWGMFSQEILRAENPDYFCSTIFDILKIEGISTQMGIRLDPAL